MMEESKIEAALIAECVAAFEEHQRPLPEDRWAGDSQKRYAAENANRAMNDRVLRYLTERYGSPKPEDPTRYYTLDEARKIPMADCGSNSATDSPLAQAIHLHFGPR